LCYHWGSHVHGRHCESRLHCNEKKDEGEIIPARSPWKRHMFVSAPSSNPKRQRHA
jgi:hypothetical protein